MTRRAPAANAQAVFEALAHGARRNILVMLGHRGGELPSGYLAARFQHSWPTTTRHLAVLEKAGLITVRRVGRSALYSLNRQYVRQVVEAWLRHLDPVGPEQTWAPSGPRSTAALRQKHQRQTNQRQKNQRQKDE